MLEEDEDEEVQVNDIPRSKETEWKETEESECEESIYDIIIYYFKKDMKDWKSYLVLKEAHGIVKADSRNTGEHAKELEREIDELKNKYHYSTLMNCRMSMKW